MHAYRLVQLAAIAASQHRLLLRQNVAAEYWGADQFWVLSRARANEWARHLKSCQLLRPNDSDFDSKSFWQSTAPVLEEFFLAEVCTRIWCATLSVVDEERLHGELDPIARSVFISSLEIRRKALRLLLFAKGLPGISTTSLNFLRRDCENWTDSLLANLSSSRIAHQFCFDKRRVQEMARQLQSAMSARLAAQQQSARLVALDYLLAIRPTKPTVCSQLNSEIATTLLSCLPADAFDGCGMQRPGWTVDSFQSDMLSINILEDLCGSLARPRYDSKGGLKDRL